MPPRAGPGASIRALCLSLLLGLLAAATPPARAVDFRRGDANTDGTLDLSDSVRTLGWLFLGDPDPPCFDAADANDDGDLDLSDAVFTLVHLFLGGPPPPSPGPEDCGEDPTTDGLDCASYPGPGCAAVILPPDPADTAPSLESAVAPSFASLYDFLYSGEDPIQRGVAPGAIEPRRVAVIRGRVLDPDQQPLAGVRVSVPGNTGLGETRSRADGGYDLAVNGGGIVCVSFESSGYPTVHRQARVPWSDLVVLPDVRMIPYDTRVTRIDLGAGASLQVAEGSEVSDADGTRRACVLFPAGTRATMRLADGQTRGLDSLGVRVTEYTFGSGGPAAMPADLPPASAYTYCVEYSADEAVAAGAVEVRFDRPLIHYNENFLGFPVGIAVPTGYYDRERQVWVASDDGVIVEVVGENGGRAELDTDGDGLADDAATLERLGVSDAERARLATMYEPGQTLWRVPIPHFTPWDCNWPFGLPQGAEAPGVPPPRLAHPPGQPDPCEESGSIILPESQTLMEIIPLAGTPHDLVYRSDRVPGRVPGLQVPLRRDTIHPDVRWIQLEIVVAGETVVESFPPDRLVSDVFTWDHRDAYGRALRGEQPVEVRVCHAYDLVYYGGDRAGFERSFAAFRDVENVVIRAQRRLSNVDIKVCETWRGTLGNWQAPRRQLGGWSLSGQHAFDPATNTLHLGDGRTIQIDGPGDGAVIQTLAGGRQAGFEGDGGPARLATFDTVEDVEIGPDGSVYIADRENGRIRRIGPEGTITTVAGGGDPTTNNLEGIPATEAFLDIPGGLGLGPEGSIYVTVRGRVRRIGPDGLITTVQEPFTVSPQDVAVAPDGSIYVTDDSVRGDLVIRVAPDGSASIVAGKPRQSGPSGDGGLASEALLASPGGIAVGPDGAVYFTDGNFIRRIAPDGIISRVGGRFGILDDLELGPDGAVHALAGNLLVRVERDGTTTRIAGGGRDPIAESVPALRARLENRFQGLGLSPDGSLVIGEMHRVRRVTPVAPRRVGEEYLIPSPDGTEVYRFDLDGRHLATLEGRGAAVLQEFSYDDEGNLVSMSDGEGNVTRLERDGDGRPLAIVGPYGHRTELTLAGSGWLEGVAGPDGELTTLAYTESGLLTAVTDPQGNTWRFSYDDAGRLVRDEGPSGGYTDLSREADDTGHTVTTTTALGQITTYRTEIGENGEARRIVTDAAGAVTERVSAPDGSRTTRFPDGTVRTEVFGPDPRWGMQAPASELVTVTTPGGRELTVVTERTVTLADLADPLSLESETETVTVGERTHRRVFDATTGTFAATTPEGRQRTARVDDRGRLVELRSAADLEPLVVRRDERGRTVEAVQGALSVTQEFDDLGRVALRRDALGRETGYLHDAADRLTALVAPSGRTYRLDHADSCCRFTRLTVPGGQIHQLGYTYFDSSSTYVAPGGGTLTEFWDADRRRTRVELPGGRAIDIRSDASGRPQSLSYPEATVTFGYTDATDRAARITRTPAAGGGAQEIAYQHDGGLLTQTRYTGAAQGSFRYTYSGEFRLRSLRLDSEPTLNVGRDADGLVTSHGPFTIERDGAGGLPSRMTDGTLTVDYTFDPLGRLAGRTYTVAGAVVYAFALERDAAGRIVRRTESVGDSASTLEYGYDPDGRLEEVLRDDVVVESYGYDANGNRTSADGVAATYDDADRLQTMGGVEHVLDSDGFLAARGGDTFSYSTRGELLSATPSGGETVTYAHDGLGRRVARTDAAGTVSYLYGDPGDILRVTATRAPGNELSVYLYDPGGVLVAFYRGPQRAWHYVAADPVGSPRLITDSAGRALRRIDYDSFGAVTADSDPGLFLPLGFAGGLVDPATGLVRFGRRDYDPAAGRWTARDPALFDGGQANLYAYAGSDPVNRRDPTGLICVGGSVYAVYGAGVKACLQDGEWSLCIEVGLGTPSTELSVTPFGDVAGPADRDYFEVSAGLSCGPIGIGGGVKFDDCGNRKIKTKCGFGPIDACADKGRGKVGGKFEELNKPVSDLFDKEFKCKPPSAKVAAGACIGSKI